MSTSALSTWWKSISTPWKIGLSVLLILILGGAGAAVYFSEFHKSLNSMYLNHQLIGPGTIFKCGDTLLMNIKQDHIDFVDWSYSVDDRLNWLPAQQNASTSETASFKIPGDIYSGKCSIRAMETGGKRAIYSDTFSIIPPFAWDIAQRDGHTFVVNSVVGISYKTTSTLITEFNLKLFTSSDQITWTPVDESQYVVRPDEKKVAWSVPSSLASKSLFLRLQTNNLKDQGYLEEMVADLAYPVNFAAGPNSSATSSGTVFESLNLYADSAFTDLINSSISDAHLMYGETIFGVFSLLSDDLLDSSQYKLQYQFGDTSWVDSHVEDLGTNRFRWITPLPKDPDLQTKIDVRLVQTNTNSTSPPSIAATGMNIGNTYYVDEFGATISADGTTTTFSCVVQTFETTSSGWACYPEGGTNFNISASDITFEGTGSLRFDFEIPKGVPCIKRFRLGRQGSFTKPAIYSNYVTPTPSHCS